MTSSPFEVSLGAGRALVWEVVLWLKFSQCNSMCYKRVAMYYPARNLTNMAIFFFTPEKPIVSKTHHDMGIQSLVNNRDLLTQAKQIRRLKALQLALLKYDLPKFNGSNLKMMVSKFGISYEPACHFQVPTVIFQGCILWINCGRLHIPRTQLTSICWRSGPLQNKA